MNRYLIKSEYWLRWAFCLIPSFQIRCTQPDLPSYRKVILRQHQLFCFRCKEHYAFHHRIIRLVIRHDMTGL